MTEGARLVRPVSVAHGSDEHLTLLGAPWHWNLLTGVDRADMLAFGSACMEAESEKWRKVLAESCADERSQMWEAGPGGGCSRAIEAEAEIVRLRSVIEAIHDGREALTSDEMADAADEALRGPWRLGPNV